MTEIGQGSSTAIKKTIAIMGANNLLVMPGTAASGGVSFGSGSVITLTPQDADAIGNECTPAVKAATPVVRARTQVVYGNKNWVPMYIYGTTPGVPDVREWTDLDRRGDLLRTRTSQSAARCACWARPSSANCSTGESPVGKEVRVQERGASAWSAC